MKLIKLAAAVLDQTPLDWAGNQSRILAAIVWRNSGNPCGRWRRGKAKVA